MSRLLLKTKALIGFAAFSTADAAELPVTAPPFCLRRRSHGQASMLAAKSGALGGGSRQCQNRPNG